EPRLARQIIVDLALVPDMIAAGEDIGPIPEQLVRELRGYTEPAGSVFAVGDGEVDAFAVDNLRQASGDNASPCMREDIADKDKAGQFVNEKERTTTPS